DIVRQIDVHDHIRRVVPPRATTDPIVAVVYGRGPWTVLDPSGASLRESEFEASPFMQTSPSSRLSVVAASGDGHSWVAAYPFGDRFSVYSNTILVCSGKYIAAGSFPAADAKRRTAWAITVGLQDSTVFVLAGGKERSKRGSVLDMYSMVTCAYEGSLRLPTRSLAMAIDQNVFYLESEAGPPAIIALRRG
ncbi:MAG TPA: hypothetical protein VHE78_00655, partial [Gemmatimonadaceae bacterium]|nr:hypothetical protein [Gemmatimonadaceae bacterium]